MVDVDAKVGRVIAELRGERSQQSIAEAMRSLGWRWSQATLWSVEKGERPLRLGEAVVLASILGTTLDALVGADPDLVLLSNRLTHVHGSITAHRKHIASLQRDLAEAEAQLEHAEQERLALEGELRSRAETDGDGINRALAAHLKLWEARTGGTVEWHFDGHSKSHEA